MGALALTALSACRNDNGAAAFVDQTKITSSYVDGVVNSVPAEVLTKLGATKAALQENVAESATFSAVAKQFAKEKGYSTPPTSPSAVTQVAQGYGLPANNAFVDFTVEASTWRAYLLSKQPQGPPPRLSTSRSSRTRARRAWSAGRDHVRSGPLGAAADRSGRGYRQRAASRPGRGDQEVRRFGQPALHRHVQPQRVHRPGIPDSVVQLPNSGGAFYANFVNMGGTANPAVLDLPAPAAAAASSGS